MKMRILTEKDAEEFRKLRLKGLQTDASAFGSTYELECDLPLKEFEQRLVPSEEQFVVGGFEENQLVCTASFIRADEEKEQHKGSLAGIYCEKAYQGTGIAKAVIEYTIAHARTLEGLKMLTLIVVSENERAKAFYETFGFETYGTEPNAMFDGVKYYDEDSMFLEL
ncbi:GNAT family N-acetyltransferase [Brochothrix thermosphacta]|uniref:GNAT family N-acetyltransferase n=1 Tax=Brochothrix thermosphacta TaxID=2756 RepID=UPI000E748D5F|nr:GNAT family N-acetyltransferase [Brochothrix thermosphacta]ANZ93954.1 GNAT family N-acetyltransferase [Brochothrix thermosphacta]